MFLSRGDRDLGVAFQTHPGRQAFISSASGMASPGSIHETGHSGLVHWDDPKRWDGEGGGRGFRMGNTCIPVADSF